MSPPLRRSRQPVVVFGGTLPPRYEPGGYSASWVSPALKQNASPPNPSGLPEVLSVGFSYGPLQVRKNGSPPVMKSSPKFVERSDSDEQGVQCPISNCVLMSVWSAAQGTMFPCAAVEYSGSSLNETPWQLPIFVDM